MHRGAPSHRPVCVTVARRPSSSSARRSRSHREPLVPPDPADPENKLAPRRSPRHKGAVFPPRWAMLPFTPTQFTQTPPPSAAGRPVPLRRALACVLPGGTEHATSSSTPASLPVWLGEDLSRAPAMTLPRKAGSRSETRPGAGVSRSKPKWPRRAAGPWYTHPEGQLALREANLSSHFPSRDSWGGGYKLSAVPARPVPDRCMRKTTTLLRPPALKRDRRGMHDYPTSLGHSGVEYHRSYPNSLGHSRVEYVFWRWDWRGGGSGLRPAWQRRASRSQASADSDCGVHVCPTPTPPPSPKAPFVRPSVRVVNAHRGYGRERRFERSALREAGLPTPLFAATGSRRITPVTPNHSGPSTPP
ncbi:hypothetical protein AAFF_G00391950 [Aldrovandia affinis]|uniref:Uncharacterized protein n=1 Tax=Aldrovandia affinis TaxID=143900 RepID=A0AAD7WKZ0_9TELE|nr:hypothetical protein AAFF_G00391950 [Aldrovandia affinis]